MPWTEMAPTGSSIRTRSKKSTENTTTIPEMRPMAMAPQSPTAAVPAVMPTRPASRPLAVMATSGLPVLSQITAMATMAPDAAERVVVMAMSPTSGNVAARLEPGLKPYQPISRIRAPSTAKGML